MQVWALQEGSDVHVGGKANRATVTFAQELAEILEEMPECNIPSSEDKLLVASVPDTKNS